MQNVQQSTDSLIEAGLNMTPEKKKLLEEILNAVFPSKEDDGVEHIDMSYKMFIRKLRKLAE